MAAARASPCRGLRCQALGGLGACPQEQQRELTLGSVREIAFPSDPVGQSLQWEGVGTLWL